MLKVTVVVDMPVLQVALIFSLMLINLAAGLIPFRYLNAQFSGI